MHTSGKKNYPSMPGHPSPADSSSADSTGLKRGYQRAKDQGGGVVADANANALQKASKDIQKKIGEGVSNTGKAIKQMVSGVPDTSKTEEEVKKKQAINQGHRYLTGMNKTGSKMSPSTTVDK